MNQGKWIYVGCEHSADIMPMKDCEVWIARGNVFGDGWIQKIDYYVEQGYFDWDGIYAYQIVTDEKPEPYIMHFANKTVECRERV